jgi:hypothetical protein
MARLNFLGSFPQIGTFPRHSLMLTGVGYELRVVRPENSKLKSQNSKPHLKNLKLSSISYFEYKLIHDNSTLEMTRRYLQSLGTEDMLKVHQKASPVDNLKII